MAEFSKKRILFTAVSAMCVLTVLSLYGYYTEISCEGSNNGQHIQRLEAADFTIPSDDVLANMTRADWLNVFWKYINRLQALCKDVIRVGTLNDGGKEICVDEPYRPRAPCIIYSFGINNNFLFDNAAVDLFGCDVYCFDPSMTNSSSRVSEHVWFYKLGLAGENKVNSKGWSLKTLDAIKQMLGHSNKTIDILKVDIEGDEWASLLQMVPAGSLRNVKQIAMETHFLSKHPHLSEMFGNDQIPGNMQLSALRQLYEAGFRIFMRERNLVLHQKWPGLTRPITNLNEISLIQENFAYA